MDTTAATTIGATVAAVVQFLKLGMPNLAGPRAIAMLGFLSILGVAVWAWSQPVLPDRTWAFGILTGWANVALTAAGAYGLIQSGTTAITRGSGSGGSAS